MHSKLLTDFKQMNVLLNDFPKLSSTSSAVGNASSLIFYFIQQITEYLITKTASSFLLQMCLILAWTLIPEKLCSIFCFPEIALTRESSTRYDGFKDKQVGDNSTEASEAHPVKQNNPLPVLWSLGGTLGCSSVWTGLSRAGTWRGLPEAMQHTKARTHAYSHIYVHVNNTMNILGPMKEHLDTLAKGNYAWKCPIKSQTEPNTLIRYDWWPQFRH